VALDWSKISELTITLSSDFANDQAILKLLPGYLPWKFLESATIEINSEPFTTYLASREINFSDSLFEGIVMEIREADTYTQVLIAAPSTLLTRNEVTQSFEEDTSIADIVKEIAPDFHLHTDSWSASSKTYYDASSAGKTIMEFLEEIADSVDKKVYVRGFNIYMVSEMPETTTSTITLDPKWISKTGEKQTGGSDAYTKVIARGFVWVEDDVVEEEEILIPDAAKELIDVVEPEDDVEDRNDLRAILNKRVREIKEKTNTRRFEMPFDPRIKPLVKLDFEGTIYIASEVEHRITRREWTTEVIAYAASD